MKTHLFSLAVLLLTAGAYAGTVFTPIGASRYRRTEP